MRIIISIGIIFCAIMVHAQTPTVQYTYNEAGFRVYRTILNPAGFQTSGPRVDTSLFSQHKQTSAELLKQEVVQNNAVPSVSGISLYPNPVVTDLAIKATDPKFENKDITVFDVTGKIVARQRMDGLGAMIDLSSLHSGIYLVRVSGSNSLQFVSRIIKQ